MLLSQFVMFPAVEDAGKQEMVMEMTSRITFEHRKIDENDQQITRKSFFHGNIIVKAIKLIACCIDMSDNYC